MSRISDLFAQDVLNKPHTDEELAEIIAYLREARARYQTGAPRFNLTEAQIAEREAKAAAKAAKAAERDARKRDPRQLDLEEAIGDK